jgi:3-phenylpropionate/trans-cinnamate dioxygenase ferredoxin subunit
LGFFDAIPTDYLEPGSTVTVAVDGFPVAIANVGGEYYAFQNLCPHQGTSLGGRPIVEDCHIVCSQHSSKYDVTSGRCVAPSVPDGFNQDLMTFETRVVDGVVQVQV